MDAQSGHTECAHRSEPVKRLNVGCGDYPLPYWINLDGDASKPHDIHSTVPPLPFGDGELDEVYAGHFLEHLSHEDAKAFLAECYRCIKPGGKLGLVVPDTREVLRRYLASAPDAVEWPHGVWWPVADLNAVCALFLYSTVQETPHRWSWDDSTLSRAMYLAGFRKINPFDRYRDPRIAQGAWYNLALEGERPRIKTID